MKKKDMRNRKMNNKKHNMYELIKTDSNLNVQQVQKFFTKTPANKIRVRPGKGGRDWKYVSGSYVTQTLNSLFAFAWSFEIMTPMSDILNMLPTGSIFVKGRLSVKIGDEWVSKEQFGRKEIAFLKNTKTPVDLGNDIKAAATDAKKKCASELGLFADVYSQEDFFETEIVDDNIKKANEEEEKNKIRKSLNGNN